MATRPGFIPIGETGEFLDSVQVDTPAGNDLHRETVVFADPENPLGLAKVTNTTPASDAYGGVVRVAGQVIAAQASPYAVIQSGVWSVEINNFPATQAVSGTVNVGNFPATQAVSGTVTANAGTGTFNVAGTVTANQGGTWNVNNITGTVSLPTGAATSADQTAGNNSLASLDGKTPDESGAWGYNAGTTGTLNVAANKRILAISATSPALVGSTMTINGGQTITIPAGTSITIAPKANLVAPTIVFTGTASYFVEFIE